jgi:hypothetical protein
MAQDVDLAQTHGVEEIANGGGVLRDSRPWRRWIRIPKSWQIRGENRAADPGNGQEAAEITPGVGAMMQAQQRSALFEATPGGDRVVDVQLAETALEVAAPDAGWGCRRARRRGFGHGWIVPQRQFGFKLFA